MYRIAKLVVRTPGTLEPEWDFGDLDLVITFVNRVAKQAKKAKKEVAAGVLRKLQGRRRLLGEACARLLSERQAEGKNGNYLRAGQFEPLMTAEEHLRLLGWASRTSPNT